MTKILKDGCQAAFDGVVSTAVYSRLPNAHHQVFVRGRQFNALQTDWGSAALFIKSEEEGALPTELASWGAKTGWKIEAAALETVTSVSVGEFLAPFKAKATRDDKYHDLDLNLRGPCAMFE